MTVRALGNPPSFKGHCTVSTAKLMRSSWSQDRCHTSWISPRKANSVISLSLKSKYVGVGLSYPFTGFKFTLFSDA